MLGSTREPIVQRATICALDAQDQGSNPRRLTVPCLGNGDPLACYASPGDGFPVRLRDTA